MKLRHQVAAGSAVCVILTLVCCGYFFEQRSRLKLRFDSTIESSTNKYHTDFNSSSALYYCNFPSSVDNELSEEGIKPIPKSVLKQVIVVIRHGDRSPMKRDFYKRLGIIPNYCKISKGKQPQHKSLWNFVETMTQDRLNLLEIGHRLPVSPVPNSIICQSAMLSQLGVVQHIHNGEILRERYVKNNNLLSKAINNSALLLHKVSAVTTTRSRTMQSAIAFLYGLIPNFHLHQINWKFSRSETFSLQPCRAVSLMERSIKKINYQSYLNNRKKASFRKLADTYSLNDHAGVLIDSFINGFLCKDIDIPCQGNVCVTIEDLNEIIKAEENAMKEISEKASYINQSMLTIQPLLEELSNFMLKRSMDNTAPDLLLYSGHDSTVKPLVRALGIPEYRWPRLGSRLVFELWSSPSESKNFIKIIFNGKDYTSLTNPCKENNTDITSVRKVCLADNFHKFVKHGIVNRFGFQTRKAACLAMS